MKKERKQIATLVRKSQIWRKWVLISQENVLDFLGNFLLFVLARFTLFLITQYVHYLALTNKRRLKSALSHDYVLCWWNLNLKFRFWRFPFGWGVCRRALEGKTCGKNTYLESSRFNLFYDTLITAIQSLSEFTDIILQSLLNKVWDSRECLKGVLGERNLVWKRRIKSI